MLLWAGFMAWLLPAWVAHVWIIFLFLKLNGRLPYFQNCLAFWSQAYRESPRKHRVLMRYAEELMRELERRYKAGAGDVEIRRLSRMIERLQDEICSFPVRNNPNNHIQR